MPRKIGLLFSAKQNDKGKEKSLQNCLISYAQYHNMCELSGQNDHIAHDETGRRIDLDLLADWIMLHLANNVSLISLMPTGTYPPVTFW